MQRLVANETANDKTRPAAYRWPSTVRAASVFVPPNKTPGEFVFVSSLWWQLLVRRQWSVLVIN